MANAFLIRWSAGWLERIDATAIGTANAGRHEDFLSAGQADSTAEALRLADSLLATFAQAQAEATMGLEPAGSDVPYVNLNVGDTLTAPDENGTAVAYRCVGFVVGEDDNGYAIFIPQMERV